MFRIISGGMLSISLRTLILYVRAMWTPLVVNLPFGVPYLRRNVVRESDASNAADVIRITNHLRRNVAAVMTGRRNEAELHIIDI
ncbi:hypothetical protein SUGI_0282540 [Cryptomeria japonica]|nr:hypothetical protein SUGI_0282540 [Cryptomeria japonica]